MNPLRPWKGYLPKVNNPALQEEQRKKLSVAICDQDPREMLSKLKIPSAEEHDRKVIQPLRRGRISSIEEESREISLWVDTESLG